MAVGVAVWLGAGVCGSHAAEVDLSKLPPPADETIDFARDIRPIFEEHCLRCHGPEEPKGGFRLDSRERALAEGDYGRNIISGDSAASPLIHYVAHLVEDMEMPPPGKGDKLGTEAVARLRAWIDQGVAWAEPVSEDRYSFLMEPSFRWITVAGDENKFRELTWMKEGWAGGIERFRFEQRDGPDRRFTAEGAGIYDDGDYRLKFESSENEKGFIRAGVEQFRKYFDDTGGYVPSFTPSSFDLDRAPGLDVGRAWIEFGLRRPEVPEITIGYEYRYKDGSKSTLEWGRVQPPGNFAASRLIYPAFKNIDEETHIVTLEFEDEWRGFRFRDHLSAEFSELDTRRFSVDTQITGKPGPDKLVLVEEGARSFQGANAASVDREIRDWWYVSAGHLYSQVDSEASFRQRTVTTPNAALPPPTAGGGFQWFGEGIDLDRRSHVLNANNRFGPFGGLTLALGVQSEFERRESLGHVRLDVGDPNVAVFAMPAFVNSDLERSSLEEHASLRFDRIPHLVLFGEGTFRQESIGQFEQLSGTPAGPDDFLRDTAASSDDKRFRAGLTHSRWERLSSTLQYERDDRHSSYTHLRDQNIFPGAFSGAGASAFIRGRDIESNEFSWRVSLRPVKWFRTQLALRLTQTDFATEHDPEPLSGTPGGTVFAGEQDARHLSAAFTLTRWQRLLLSTSLTVSDSRTETFANNSPAVVPYDGAVYSLLTSATWVLDDATDLFGSWSFSRADFGQSHFASGLPLGITYELHSLQAGVSRRWSDTLNTTVKYLFYDYREPTSGHANDFRAHGVFGMLSLKLP